MHHHYDSDKEAMRFLLESTNVPYIGVLGPKRRTVRMLSEMRQGQSAWNIDSRRSSLFAPVGLDIGAETPEEIALSILAEIKAYYRNKTALLLRDKDGPIHDDFDSINGLGHENSSYSNSTTSDPGDSTGEWSSVEYVHLQCPI
jgi:xanthine/CO dehydrogenase XdhC/CoxF family maturation factor